VKPLDLNLASRPFTNDTPLVVGLIVLALLAFGFTAYDVHAWLTADTRKATLESQIADHRVRMRQMKQEAERLQKELDGLDLEVLSAQAEFVADVLRQRNFSWTRLFNDLEDVLPWNVRLVSIRPSFEAGQILLSLDGVARHKKALFDFEEILEQSPRFSRVTPEGFRRAEGSNNVLFSLQVRYTPAAVTGGENAADVTGERASAAAPGKDEVPAEVIEVEGEETEAPRAGEPAPGRDDGAGAAAAEKGPSGSGAGRVPGSRGGSRVTGRGGGGAPSRPGRAKRDTGRPSAGAAGSDAGVAGFVPAGRVGRAGGTGRTTGALGGKRSRVAPDRVRKTGGGASAGPGAAPRERKTPEPANPEDVVVVEDGVPKIKLKPVPGSDGWGSPPSSGEDQGEGEAGGEGGDDGGSGGGDSGDGQGGAR